MNDVHINWPFSKIWLAGQKKGLNIFFKALVLGTTALSLLVVIVILLLN